MAFTFFFRDQQVLERVVEHLLPSLAGRSHPRIWDAGAAMGQEPYTLAMILAESMGHFAFNNLRIDATDVESTGQFAQIIEAGRVPEGGVVAVARRHPGEVLRTQWQTRTTFA